MIRFYSIEIPFRFSNKKKYYSWIRNVAKIHGKEIKSLSVNFCSDSYLLQLNKQFLNHDYYTDIITFDYCNGNDVYGELYISVDRVKENAEENGIYFGEELNRVIIHGVLHLLGFKDKTIQQSREMRRMEEASLKVLDI